MALPGVQTAVRAVIVSLLASAHIPRANCLDEWSVPNPSSGLDRNRIPISIPISGMAHPSLL